MTRSSPLVALLTRTITDDRYPRLMRALGGVAEIILLVDFDKRG